LISDFGQHRAIAKHAFQEVRHRLLFVHGTSIAGFADIWSSQMIRDRTSLGLKGRPHQHALGTEHSVFFSVSTVHPDRQVVLALRLDPADVVVSPWDSGAFWRCDAVPDASRVSTFHEFSLPEPDWRDYFAGRVLRTFDEPRDYFLGMPPDRDHAADHGCRGNYFSSVFEARASGPIELAGRVRAFIYPEMPGLQPPGAVLIEAAETLKRQGTHVATYRRNGLGPSLRRVFSEWMLKELGWE
jgi:hypothetical protein